MLRETEVSRSTLSTVWDNYYIIIVSIAVAFTNFVDNDLFSYNFLPILLLAFNSNIQDTIKLPFEGGNKNKND